MPTFELDWNEEDHLSTRFINSLDVLWYSQEIDKREKKRDAMRLMSDFLMQF